MPTLLAFKAIVLSFIFSLLAVSSTVASADDEDMDQMLVAELLTQEKAPDGVVFELIGNEGDYLLKAIKKVETYKEQLQEKFPKLEIAVVSHGSEQFNLTKSKAKQTESKETHTRVQRLVESDVPVHICAVHASWRDVLPEDFPDYISVSSTGPAEIRNYQEFGYQLIVVE